jgi:hypothetical protein
MKPKRMPRQDSRFDAALGADENDFVTEISGDAGERERRHEMAASAAACDEKFHDNCGLWISDCGFDASRSQSAIHNPQSAIT